MNTVTKLDTKMPPTANKKVVHELIAVAIGLVIAFLPPPDELTAQSMWVLGLLLWAIVNWMLKPIPDYVAMILKEAGAMAAVLSGRGDALILTGGLAHMQTVLVPFIKEHMAFLSSCLVYPGENEMRALAEMVSMVMKDEMSSLEYR